MNYARHYTTHALAAYEPREPRDDGYVVVEWLDDDARPTGIRCDGYMCRGRLFLPADGQAEPGTWTGEPPDPHAGWYDPLTGQWAIVGLPQQALSTLC